ncbi:MATE efflux family protein [Xylariaceae sp. FL0016]|nr:MATE efflux family protein [Xylariaceae sp. FL0016]
MPDPKPIPPKKASKLNMASSFTAGSPLAQEILARDLAECSDNEDIDHSYHDDEPEAASNLGPVLYKQPSGVAFGFRRPSVLNEAPNDIILTRAEREESRHAERSLLRDNHLLPPKHDHNKQPGLFSKTYRRLFSTKVRKSSEDEEAGQRAARPSERTPLLAETQLLRSPSSDLVDQQWEAAVAIGAIETTWQREAKTIATYSRSLILTSLLQYSVNITSMFTVGHLGTMELGAISLATMTANICCYAPMQGLATSLDTLCSQAYGSGHKHLVGLQLQRMTFFLWLLMIPIAFIFFFAEDALLHIVPEVQHAKLAGSYLRIVILSIPGFAAFEGGKKYVQAQGIPEATTYVLLIAAPINVFINWFLVWYLGWGFVGAPIAVAFTFNFMPVLLLLYVCFVDGSQCWGGFTRKAFTNWGPMVRLAFSGMVMVVAEWLAFEILTLVSSQFGASYLAAQSILVTLTSTTFMIPFPVSIAASTRIANLIGARLVSAARTSANVAFITGLAIGLFNLILLSSLRFQLPRLFTQDEDVITIVATVMPLCAIMQVFDGSAAIAHGLLRGIGKQSFGGYANVVVYYLIALPISLGTAFGLSWNLKGLWFGCTIGLLLCAAVEYWYAYVSDWEQSVREAEHRNTAG